MKTRFLLAIAVLTLSVSASAQDSYRLEYSAPAECIAKERFADEVAARAGRLVFDDSAGSNVAVRILRDGDGFLATLRVDGQSRIATATTCDAATTQLAEAAAVLFQLEAPVQAPAAALPATPSNNEFLVRLTSEDEGFTAHRLSLRGYAFAFERLCTAPCEFSLPHGSHEVSAAPGTQGGPRTEPFAFDLNSDVELHGTYHSGRGARITMGVGGFLLWGAGWAGFFRGLFSRDADGYKSTDVPLLSVGIGGLVVGTVLMMVAMLTRDRAEWQVRPLAR